MTKPKNMTPEQDAIWRERDRLRRNSPEYKAKGKIRSRRWYEKPGHDAIVKARNKASRNALGGKEHRNLLERERIRRNPELKEKEKIKHKLWMSTERGKRLNREKSARCVERKKHYDHFLSSMNLEGDDA